MRKPWTVSGTPGKPLPRLAFGTILRLARRRAPALGDRRNTMEHGSAGQQLKVGIFVLVGIGLTTWLALRFGEFEQGFADRYPLTVIVRDASGIRDGSPVRLGGIEIGRVSGDPELSEDATALSIPILVDEGRRLPRGAKMKVATSGLMGDTYIRVTPPETADEGFLEPGDTVSGADAQMIDEIAGGALDTLERAASVLEEIGRSLSSLNAIVTKVDEELLSEEHLRDLGDLLGNLRGTSESLVTASARLDPLLEETALAIGSVREAADGAGAAFGEVTEGVRDFSRTVATVDPVVREFDGTLDRLRITLDNLDSLLRRVDSGEGLASALLHDESLRDDLSSFVDKLERHGILFYPREPALLRRRSEGAATGPSHSGPLAPREPGADDPERPGLLRGWQGLGPGKARPGSADDREKP